MTAIAANPERFNLFFTLTKVDEKQRLVYGRATQEVPDAVREVMDYATSKPYFEKWSAAAKARTAQLGPDGLSLGNVREMHEPVAAGKVIDLTFNDLEKAIDIGTYCADDSAWNKILKGVLTGFSVGGSYVKRWPDYQSPSLIRYTANPAEVSYVDSPAVPTATFTMIKEDGTQELRKAQQPDGIPMGSDLNPAPNVPPVDDDINAAQPQVDKIQHGLEVKPINTPGGFANPDVINPDRGVVQGTAPRQDPVSKTDAPDWAMAFEQLKGSFDLQLANLNLALDWQKAQTLDLLAKLTGDDKEKAEIKLKALGARVGISRKSGEPLTPPKGYPTDPNDYGDPANWSWPYDEQRVGAALARFNGGAGKDKYSDREWNILGRRIATRATKQYGRKYTYSPSSKEIEGEETEKMQKVSVGPLLQQVQQALNVAADQIGNDPQAMKDLLMGVVANLDSAATTSPASPGGTPNAPTGSQQSAGTASLGKVEANPTAGGSPYGSTDATKPTGGTPTTPMTGTPAVSTEAATQKTAAVTETPTTVPTKTAATPPPDSSPSSSPSTSPSTPAPGSPESFKALSEKVDRLTETMGKLVEFLTGAPVAKNAAPVVNLNGLQTREVPAQDDGQPPIMKAVLDALTSGDKQALKKAAVVAGTEERPDLEAVYDMAREKAVGDLAKSGLFSALYMRGALPSFNPAEFPTEDK